MTEKQNEALVRSIDAHLGVITDLLLLDLKMRYSKTPVENSMFQAELSRIKTEYFRAKKEGE